jgi:hypothetical protein
VRLRPEFYRGSAADWRIWGVPVLPVAGAGAIAFAIFCMIDAAVFHTQNGVSNVVWMVILPWVVVISSVIYYPDARTLVLMMTNKGKYTITRVEAQFSPDGKSLLPHDTSIRIANLDNLPDKLRAGQPDLTEAARGSVLTPWDAGMRFECQRVHKKDISGPYAVVRWTDRWGRRWEH